MSDLPITNTSNSRNTRLGLVAAASAIFLFSGTDVIAKWLGHQGYAPTQIVFLRYLFGLIPVFFMVQKSGIDGLRTHRPFSHALRACLIFGAIFFFFWGIKLMPLSEAIAIAFTAPLFVALLSIPLLGERVGKLRWAALLIGFVGAMIIIRPGTEAFRVEYLLIILSALLFAFTMILTRNMAVSDTNVSMFTYTTLGATFISGLFMWASWKTPSLQDLFLFILLGAVGGGGAYLLIVAYRNVSTASVAATFEYTALIWASLFAWYIWGEIPGINIWSGALTIIAAGLLITWGERPSARAATITNQNPGNDRHYDAGL